MSEVEKAVAVRVSSLADLARLAIVPAARYIVMPVYRFKWNGRVIYMVHMSFKDYYKKYGIPLIYYYSRSAEEDEPEEKAKYILIKVDDTGERVEISNSTKTGYVSIPIVNLAEKPAFVPDDLQ
ncbi:hypothetical protein [Stetteria hydrogenophila]